MPVRHITGSLMVGVVMLATIFVSPQAHSQNLCADLFAQYELPRVETPQGNAADLRALDLLAEVRELLALPEYQRSDVDAVLLFRKVIDAPLKSLSTWIQDRSNYPSLAIENAKGPGVEKNYKRMARDLERVGKWTSLKKSFAYRIGSLIPKFKKNRIEKLVTKVRNHHWEILNDLKELETETNALRKSSTELHERLDAFLPELEFTTRFLKVLEAEILNTAGKSASQQRIEQELLRQTASIHKDMIDILTVSSGVGERIDQGITYNITMDTRVRSLLEKHLPIVIATSSEPIDLSPLRKNEEIRKKVAKRTTSATMLVKRMHYALAGATLLIAAGIYPLMIPDTPTVDTATPVVEQVVQDPQAAVQTATAAPTINPTATAIKNAIEKARATRTHEAHNQILFMAAKDLMPNLTVNDAIKLARATTQTETHNAILSQFAHDHVDSLTMKDAIEAAKATTTQGAHNDILQTFAHKQASSLSVADAITVARATQTYVAQDNILVTYAQAHITKLSVKDALALGKATGSGANEDAILFDYAQANAATLTAAEMTTLARAAHQATIADRILMMTK